MRAELRDEVGEGHAEKQAGRTPCADVLQMLVVLPRPPPHPGLPRPSEQSPAQSPCRLDPQAQAQTVSWSHKHVPAAKRVKSLSLQTERDSQSTAKHGVSLSMPPFPHTLKMLPASSFLKKRLWKASPSPGTCPFPLHCKSQERSEGEPSWEDGEWRPEHSCVSNVALPPQNIFHGAMTLDQLYFARPTPLHAGHRCPLPGLYLCGSGAHPGEGPSVPPPCVGGEGWRDIRGMRTGTG